VIKVAIVEGSLFNSLLCVLLTMPSAMAVPVGAMVYLVLAIASAEIHPVMGAILLAWALGVLYKIFTD